MRRGLLRFTVSAGLPPLVHRHPGGVTLAPLGRWLSERIASQVPDFPATGFHRLEITPEGIELLLVASDRIDAPVAFAQVMEVIRRDTDGAARRSGWGTDRIWQDAQLIMEQPPSLVRRSGTGADKQDDCQHEEDPVHRPRGEVV
jgi:hypothetical protein